MERPGGLAAELVLPLARLRRGLRALLVLRGVGLLVAVASATLLLAYGVDRALDLPRSVRVLLLGVGVAAVLWTAFRALARPLAGRFGTTDAALALERNHPSLAERLVTAVESPSPRKGESGELLLALHAEAARAVSSLRPTKSLDGRRPFGAAGAGALLGIGASLFLARPGSDASVFFARLVGGSVPWPRRTFLEFALPEREGAVRVTQEGARVRAVVPAGADLPLRIVAMGIVPPEVLVHWKGGPVRPATRTGAREFLFTLRGITSPVELFATGGDDRDEVPTLEVVPRRPPDVAGVAVDLVFPAYTGLPSVHREGGSFEAPVGSQASLEILAASPAVGGTIRFQRRGEEIPLAPAENGSRFAASFEVRESDRYLVSLVDAEGLRTAQPAVYAVTALPDRKPEVRVLSPERTDFEVTPTAAIPLRARANDDFGLARFALHHRVGREGPPVEVSLLPPPSDLPGPPPREARRSLRLEVPSLDAGERAPREGEFVEFFVEAIDNRPEPNRAESPRFRALVVPPEEALRKLNDAIARIKEEVEALGRLQREKVDRLNELLASLEGDAGAGRETRSFAGAAAGERRVTTAARRVVAGFEEVFETAAYNRLERAAEAAIAVLESLREEEAPPAPGTPSFEEEGGARSARVRALLQRAREGALGAPEFLGKVLEMLAAAEEAVADPSARAASALERAAGEVDSGALRADLAAARAAQDETLEGIDRLLVLLAEWDNYQAVIQLAREILEAQRSVNRRTQESLRDR